MDWFHVDPEALHEHEAVLTGEEWRHAFLASRHRAGDRIGLVDGLGNRGEAVIETVTAGEGRLRLLEWGPDPREREPFFFELEGGDTIHPATQRWIQELRERYGWSH